jgi:16S rRNA (uracil1498-N3)-methyltransferase
VHRFYAPGWSESDSVSLPEEEAHHLARVLRLRAGDMIAVFDGCGREAVARIESVTARRVNAQIVESRTAAPEPRVAVTLAQALLKSDKMDRVIRDAVMLGVTAIQPFVGRRSDVPMKAVTSGGRQHRWDRTVISSVKQCGRAVVPPVYQTQEFPEVLSATSAETRLMFVEPAAGVDPAELTSLEGQRPSTVVVFVGPEGGWDPQELSDATGAGVQLLSFGRRVLRADAAAATVIPVLRYIWKDL